MSFFSYPSLAQSLSALSQFKGFVMKLVLEKNAVKFEPNFSDFVVSAKETGENLRRTIERRINCFYRLFF